MGLRNQTLCFEIISVTAAHCRIRTFGKGCWHRQKKKAGSFRAEGLYWKSDPWKTQIMNSSASVTARVQHAKFILNRKIVTKYTFNLFSSFQNYLCSQRNPSCWWNVVLPFCQQTGWSSHLWFHKEHICRSQLSWFQSLAPQLCIGVILQNTNWLILMFTVFQN